VLHIGAHLAEEYEDMCKSGWGTDGIIWVESQQELCDQINSRFEGTKNKVICATIWSEDNIKKVFHENTNTQSSSLFELGIHKKNFPEMTEVNTREVTTRKIDSIIKVEDEIDFVNLDIQGSELEALKGAINTLTSVKWVYTEVNRKEIYKSCPMVDEIDAFMKTQGFCRVATRWSFRDDWGDALYVRDYDVVQSIQFKVKELISIKLLQIRYLNFLLVLHSARQFLALSL
jgi:FkbM family methyltransferase